MKIIKPTLLIDRKKCQSNISRMVNKSLKYNLNLRPHFKTHQSAIIGELFKDFNINTITVSSVSMAIYFEKHGWKNITIAFPVNILEIDQIFAPPEGDIELKITLRGDPELLRFPIDQLKQIAEMISKNPVRLEIQN